ncbi:hypothetical protein Acsp01_15200 [Actinoplanes sp. NBRC 101535]|nr:hypothetical protein Acsp01_15200 [Actinoplanes sp. NBRC 101535]
MFGMPSSRDDPAGRDPADRHSRGCGPPAPDTRQRFLGFMEWAGSLGTNADSVVTRADGLGQIFTTITAGQRAETE